MSPAARSIVEHVRQALDAVDELDPAEQEAILVAIVADLRSRRPTAIAPMTLGPPTDRIRDPRSVR